MTEIQSRPSGMVPEGPVPPQALEAERSVLAAMLLDHEAVGRAVEQIDGTVFYRTAHQRIFDAIVGLYNRSEKADLVTLSEELRKRGELELVGGPAALSQIMEYATTTANLEQHMRLVHSKAILRLLIKASSEIQQECFAAAEETPLILDKAEQRIFEITDRRVRQGFVSLKDLLKPAFEYIHELSERKAHVTGVPSGYEDIDKLTSGFQASDLIIVAGRPGFGKTSFAMNMAENAAIRYKIPVAIFSLEMSKEQLVMRMLCSQSEVALHKVRNGFLGQEDWPRLTTGAGLLTQAPIMIDDSAALTTLEIRAKCRRLRAENKLGLIVIDYLQLMRAAGTVENRVQEISQITRGLKALAKELQVPIIALSQLSRAVETRGGGGRPQLSDLRESGCLTADTRIVRADTGAEVSLGELLLRGERDIPVWTLDDEMRIVRGTMTHVFASGVKKVFALRMTSGRVVKASANHPFLTMDGWRRLDSLEPGDRLAAPRVLPDPLASLEWPEAEVVMLAHLIGDGCFASRQPLHYTSADEENLLAVERAAAHFGVTPRRVKQGNWTHVYLPSPYRLTHGKHNPICAWLSGFGLNGLRSWEKYIPREVFNLSNFQLATFLRHLWATDGCIHLGADPQPHIYYATTSRRLATDVQMLLLRFGITARLKVTQKADYRPGYQVHVYGREDQLKFLGHIDAHGAKREAAERVRTKLKGIRSKPNVDTIPREVWGSVETAMVAHGFTTRAFQVAMGGAYCGSTLYRHSPSRPRLQAIATLLLDPELERLARSDVFWDQVASIEELGEEPVFDATVLGTHNFIADGMLAHNSIEQDADLVMFVFREEKYKPDDPTVKGKAQIIIAKQRNGPTGDVDMTFLHEFTKFVPYSPLMPGEADPGF
jgi:replicative DNA helicase